MRLSSNTCMEVHIQVSTMDIYGQKFTVSIYFKNSNKKESWTLILDKSTEKKF